MNKFLYSIFSLIISLSAIASNNVDEFIIEEDPYIGVKIDFKTYQPMVYLTNVTEKLNPSRYVQDLDRLITSLAQSKTASNELFKKNNKKVFYLDPNLTYRVKQLVKTAVYKDNQPDEYTSYILEDNNGQLYAIPDFELKDLTNIKLSSYEKGLIEKFNSNNNYARVVIYLRKPDLYKDKQAPYSDKELSSVFNYFLDKLKSYHVEKVLFSERNFRLSASININTLVYLISEMDNLYIEDIEVISTAEKKEQEDAFSYAKTIENDNYWYNREN